MEPDDEVRVETDSLGDVRVPAGAYYGAQTRRAVENFPISDLRLPRRFIRALARVKWAAAGANRSLGLLDGERARAIGTAAREVMDGKHDDQFVVDVFQTGSGTSTNMNMNEVLANRAIEILDGEIGSREPVHPNDHVNLCQSSNDVIPTALHVAVRGIIEDPLLPALEELAGALEEKADAFDGVLKIGRTHLQDATPVRLGQEFGGWARQVRLGIERVRRTAGDVEELPLGGTAVGTGLNRHPDFPAEALERLNEDTGLEFREARDHFEAQGARDAMVSLSGALKTLAVSLMKIANDVRWASSGPRNGLGEIEVNPVQPGSSIMPGKINPVIAESVCQVAAQVIGNDAAIATGGQAGNFELNVMKPVIAHNVLQSLRLLASSSRNFARRCIRDLEVDEERCEKMVERALALCTALAPHVGYDRAAEISKKAYARGQTIREVAREENVMDEETLDRVLDARAMTEPGIPGSSEEDEG